MASDGRASISISSPWCFTPQPGEVRVLLQLVDDHVLQLRPQVLDHVDDQVVRQRPRRGVALHAAVDAGGLEDADEDGKGPLAPDLLQVNDLLVVPLTDNDPRQFHRDRHGRILAHEPRFDRTAERPTEYPYYKPGRWEMASRAGRAPGATGFASALGSVVGWVGAASPTNYRSAISWWGSLRSTHPTGAEHGLAPGYGQSLQECGHGRPPVFEVLQTVALALDHGRRGAVDKALVLQLLPLGGINRLSGATLVGFGLYALLVG